MKIKLLIATSDMGYQEHLTKILWEKYEDAFEISVCSSTDRVKSLNRYDAALLEPDFLSLVTPGSACFPLVLWDGLTDLPESAKDMEVIRKYQRISVMTGEILSKYAEFGTGANKLNYDGARITAVWSPAGGVGKTTVAVALAASKSAAGKQAVYFNLENFTSSPIYFAESGKSISTVFEKLDSNIHILLTGIRQKDSESGVIYYCAPDNYDDINELTVDDVENLVKACASRVDELVVDLSSSCDARVRKVLDMADTVLLVCDNSSTSQAKLRQFYEQHNVWHQVEMKSVLVNNKGAAMPSAGLKTVYMPLITASSDPVAVYKTLAGGKFEW
jgi:RecA/RadA recombinase